MGSEKTNGPKTGGLEPSVDNHDPAASNAWSERLSDKDFNRLGEFITEHLGIKMPPVKKVLVESRLRRRLRILNLHSYTQYCDYLFSTEGLKNEVIYFTNEITTNKTGILSRGDPTSIIWWKKPCPNSWGIHRPGSGPASSYGAPVVTPARNLTPCPLF